LKKILLISFLVCNLLFGSAQNQIDCKAITSFLNNIEQRINNINTTDPELITLHYLFTIDIENELHEFYKTSIPHLSQCPSLDFNKIINTYDWARHTNQILKDSLSKQKELVDQIFFQNGYIEFQLKHYDKALYLIDRSLQFKPLQADPLLLKLEIQFILKKHTECVDILNIIYYQVQLNDFQEKQTIDFNLKFYDELYRIGDSLVKIDKAIDAFKIFGLLETFCNNMPSGYCNDDYYHGLLRSKVGMYESYLKIAAIAKERGNYEMEKKFELYAQEYLDANRDLLIEMNLPDTYRQTENTKIETIDIKENHQTQKNKESKAPTVKPKEVVSIKTEPKNDKTVAKKEREILIKDSKKNQKEEINRKEPIDTTIVLYKKYQEIVSIAIEHCIRKEFDAAYDQFLAAQELEKCECFPKDARIDLFLSELRKIRGN